MIETACDPLLPAFVTEYAYVKLKVSDVLLSINGTIILPVSIVPPLVVTVEGVTLSCELTILDEYVIFADDVTDPVR